MIRIAIALLVVMTGAAGVAAQQGLRGKELVGYHATAVSEAMKQCGGGAIGADLRALLDVRDPDFRFGMARAIGDWSGRLERDRGAACAELRQKYGPAGTVAPGAWVLP